MKKTILLVDDEVLIAREQERKIRDFGYDVVVKHGGDEAVTAATGETGIDLILMDLDLGKGASGPEAARQILERRPVPIVFLATPADRDIAEQTRGITHYGCVIKSSSDSVLQSSIETAFELFNEAQNGLAERRRAEHAAGEEIKRMLSFQQVLLDAIPAPIFYKDAECVYTGGNKAFEQFIGLSREQFIGKTVFDIAPADLAEIYDRTDKELLNNPGHQTYETSVANADGLRHHVVFNTATFSNAEGKINGLIGVILDISDRKQVEEALLESEARFRGISAVTSDIAYSCNTGEDVDFSIDWISGASSRITGYSNDEIKAQGCWRFLVVDDDIPLFEKNVIGLPPGSQGSCELRIRHKNGRIVWISSSAECSLAPRKPGRLMLYGGLVDITERKHAEEKIQTLLREKEILLKEVHHRIKNNMSAMMAMLTLQADTLNEPAAVRALKEARNRMQSMSVLYDRLYISDNVRTMSVAYYIPGLLSEIVPLFPNSSSVSINMHIDDFTLDVKILSSLGIIVNELITNAMKYAFPGRADGVITVSASKRDTRATLIIEDNGIGIPEIFDIGTTASFGLRLVGMLVKQISGGIRIERVKGTRILIEFEA